MPNVCNQKSVIVSQKTTFSIIQWECTDSGSGISENRVLVLRHWGANIPLRPQVRTFSHSLAQKPFSSIIVITINIWLRFHNGREIWSDEVNALYSLEISSFSSSPVGLLVVIVGFYPAVLGSIPGCRYWIISSFGYFLPFLKICPNFQIFSMSPLLSAKYSKVKIFSGKCRDPKVPLCIVFITGTWWYIHKSGTWKSAFSLLKLGSLQMFTSHK